MRLFHIHRGVILVIALLSAVLVMADRMMTPAYEEASTSNPVDVTELIENPNVDGNDNGWTIDAPGARDLGYQGGTHTNGSVSVSQFLQCWTPSGGYIGACSMTQTISDLPEGIYQFEADCIGCDQSGAHTPAAGIKLIGEYIDQDGIPNTFSTSVATSNKAPQHFSTRIHLMGSNTLTIGMRSEANTTANWMCMDNMTLKYYGPGTCSTTAIKINTEKVGLMAGAEYQLKVSITTANTMYKQATWKSSNPDVVTVDQNGMLKAISTGTAIVTARAICTDLKASATVTVAKNSTSGLIINEVMVANNDQYIDPSYNYGGWIELHNTTDHSILLLGMYVSDGTQEYWLTSAHGSIEAGAYKTIWFDHNAANGNYGGQSSLHVPYKLKADGGTIQLLDADHMVVDAVDYPTCVPRCSYARTTDGGSEWSYTATPSPAASNNSSRFAEFRLNAPVVDTDSRLFTSGFTVNVDIPTGTTLRYTTDGSAPTASRGATSKTGTFKISTTTILRMCLIADGYLPSPVVTRSYIYQNHPYYLPVISIATNPDNFYNDTIGIYVKGTNGTSGNGQSSACNWNRDWERPVNMEYIVPQTDGTTTTYDMQVNQEVDLEICGGWSRAYGGSTVDGKTWPMHGSFRVKTDKRYEGVNEIACPVFPSKPHQKYRVWQVRNGGNDTKARIKDPAIQQIVLTSGFNVDCQDYQPAHVFFNGEYFAMLNIRESNNKHFGYSNFGIDTDDMDQFDLSDKKYNQKAGDKQAWTQLQQLAQQLAKSPSEATYRQICDLLDIDEYINYMALECYMGPSDWITNTNNVKGYRSRSDDGKFRFVLFDTDSAWSNENMINSVMNTGGGADVDDLFRNLMTYPAFRRQFVDSFCVVDGSIFEPARCKQIIQAIYDNINTAIGFEGNSSSTGMISTIEGAHNGNRVTNMRSYMGLGSGNYVTLSANIDGARLMVNGQQIPTGKFAGYLFSYDKLPVNITAKAPAGYTFRGWASPSTTKTETVLIEEKSKWWYYDQGSMDAFNWKALSFAEKAHGWQASQAPFGYANSGYYMLTNANTVLDYGGNKSDKRPTYYFRNVLTLDKAPTSETSFQFNYQVDDGIMLYVNGEEVEGYYITSGSSYSDYTTGGHYEGQTPHSGTFVIPNNLLHKGDNCIAVEVKNTSASSTDVYFDASITMVETGDAAVCSDQETMDITQQFAVGERITLTAIYDPAEQPVAPIRINEVSAGNDIYINEYGKKADWIELYNTTDEEIPLSGLYLSDDSSNPQKYQFTEGTIAAHSTCIVWCDGKESAGQLHAPFKLANDDGAYIGIRAEDGSWTDGVNYQAQPRWHTYGRFPDGGCHMALLPMATIDKPNHLGTFDFTAITPEEWDTDGIQSIPEADDPSADMAHGDLIRTLYYNMAGQLIARPQTGIYIKKLIYSDGTSRTEKVKIGPISW